MLTASVLRGARRAADKADFMDDILGTAASIMPSDTHQHEVEVNLTPTQRPTHDLDDHDHDCDDDDDDCDEDHCHDDHCDDEAFLAEKVSYTQKAVCTLAAPKDMPRPRGLFRQHSVLSSAASRQKRQKKEDHPTFFATRANMNVLHKSTFSRITYTIVLLNMTIWIPPWLKLLTIRRNEHQENLRVNIHNGTIGLHLNVSTFEDSSSSQQCSLCDNRDHRIHASEASPVWAGVTYPVSARIEHFSHQEHVQTGSRVALFGSFDWEHWFILNEPGLFTGIHRGDQNVELCLDEPITDDYVDDFEQRTADQDDYELEHRKKTQFTLKDHTETTTVQQQEDDAVEEENTATLEKTTTWVTSAPTIVDEKFRTDAPTPLPKEYKSRCCLGTPGFTYLVACITPFEAIYYADFYSKIAGPGFEDRCFAVTGRCGNSCGVDATAPVDGTCDAAGNIPLKKLLDKRVFDGSGKKRKKRHYDRTYRFDSYRTQIYHTLFVLFVTMTTTGTWVSFLAGNGLTFNPPKPSMTEIEDYMAAPSKSKKPLILVTFSISASEPRMMVLRNFCGKLMSWLNQRKFTLMQRNAADAIFGGDNGDVGASTLFDDEDDEALAADKHLEANNHAELVDIFQDEGHRVGAYALWDAFVDIVHDADLRFIEALATKMTHMTAEDDRLLGKEEDDGFLLDDELRSFITKTHIGVSQESVDKLELAYACFDLLNALGHHAYWRSDRNVNVAGFRDLALRPEAADVLKQWATNFRKAPKGSNPFAPEVTPTKSEGIEPNLWNNWWELYSEMGFLQWMKRFDMTKFRLARLHFYRDREESVFRDLVMCYSARANPEDVNRQLAATVNLRGIRKGVFVRLKDAVADDNKKLFTHYNLRRINRSEARRCHARLLGFTTKKRVRYVKVKECTPELLQVLPMKWLACEGHIPKDTDDDDDDDDSDDDDLEAEYEQRNLLSSSAGEEAIIPIDLVEPLRQSRGKSGGMNHAMEILNHYIRHHSSTFNLLKTRYKRKRPPPDNNRQLKKSIVGGKKKKHRADAHLLFAIFDCRHMATQGFWDAVIPYFYGYKHQRNPWARGLKIDGSVAFVQLPQTFTSLSLDSDIFDMRNEYLFRIANNIRNGVGAITSCGTNAVWNYDIRFQENPLEHRFNEDTMIEDTASSHDVIIEGRTGIYHFERLVLGARKGTNDYLAAVFRWSRGAVQLFWTTFWFPRYYYVWPWIVLVVHIGPIIGIITYLQLARLDECHHTKLTSRLEFVPCKWGPAVGLVLDPLFLLYVIFMITLATVSFHWCRVGAYLIMFENVTYFFTSSSAFFWICIPMYMCIAKNGLPVVLDTQLICLGGLWVQLHMGFLLQHVKAWSPLEDGAKPNNQSLLRSQQMFLVNAPLHVLATLFGFRDGLAIIFRGMDASRWNSFDNKMAIIAVKVWMIILVSALFTSLGFGLHRVIKVDDTEKEVGERLLGIALCIIILFLIETPVRAMFYFESVVKAKQRPSLLARLTKAIFGRSTVPRPDFVYGLLWFLLFIYSLQFDELAESTGILNINSRCQNDRKLPGCQDPDIHLKTKMDINLISSTF